MARILRSYLLIVLLAMATFLLPGKLLSQSFAFRNYNTVQGLSSSEVYSSLQDSKGYMWLCTDRGIVRYDGYTFRPFTTADGMPDNTVFQAFEDTLGRIWFITYSLKVGYIQDEKIYIYPYNSIIKAHVPYAISDMHIDEACNLWIGWDTIIGYKLIRISPDGRIDSSFSCPYSDKKKIYLTKKGPCLISGKKLSKQIEFISPQTGEVIASYPARKEIATNARAWYIKKKDKVWAFIDNEAHLIENKTSIRAIYFEGKIGSFMVDSTGNLWVGYINKGVEIYTIKSDYKKHFLLLKNYSVTSINQDKQGGIWFTTLENGVYYLPPSAPISYTKEDGLPTHIVREIENIDGNMIITFPNGDLALKEPSHDNFKVCKNKTSVLINLDIKFKSPDVIYYNGYRELPIPLQKRKKIFVDDGKPIIGEKHIWSISFPLVHKLDEKANKIKSWSFLNISRTRCGFENNAGNLLVGTLDGLFECTDSGVIAYSKYNPIWSKRISDICRIDKDYIAIATIGYGLLIVFHDDYSHPVQYLIKDGIPSIMCNKIHKQNDTTIYLGTNKGLCLITNIQYPAKTKFRTIDINNGIISNEINDITELGDDIWIATINGLSIIPKAPGPANSPSPIYLEKVVINDKIIDKHVKGIFSFVDNKISFFYTALNFEYAGKLLYAYRIKPIDKKWNYTNNRSIIYNSLAPGRYIIEIAVIDPIQKLPGVPVSYAFEILPPFWQTWWFIGITGLLLAVGINLFIRYRIKVVKARELLNNDLQNLKEKALRAQMKPHFIYNSLTSVQNYILKNEMTTSVSFLSKFSKLMRLTFSNTNKGLVSLKDDIEALELYTELENLRFNHRINFHIHISNDIDIANTFIPPLLIQPFVENAILHGLHTKEEKGNVWVNIEKENESIKIQIKDDGIGRAQASRISEKKQKYRPVELLDNEERDNSGIIVTAARIAQSWGRKTRLKKPEKELFNIIDLYDENNLPAGTLIEFYLPNNHDKSINSR